MSKTTQVLLVEDNRADAIIVRDALRKYRIQFELHEMMDAEEAANYLKRMGSAPDAPYPDIVLLDLNLPKGDGIEVLQLLRSAPKCAETPVIVMTSSDSPRDRKRVAELGANRYFRKPIDLEAFLALGEIVREVLEEHAK